jgi:hypothetical protein
MIVASPIDSAEPRKAEIGNMMKFEPYFVFQARHFHSSLLFLWIEILRTFPTYRKNFMDKIDIGIVASNKNA